VLHAIPDGHGQLRYDEGLLIGYRGFDRAGTSPRFPFGHGLGYTTWALASAHGPAQVSAGRDLEVVVVARNTGTRPGSEVVQAYVAAPAPGPASGAPGDERRPVRTLAAFGRVTAAPGEEAEVRLCIPARAFARYDENASEEAGEETQGWVWPRGEWTVEVGRSSRDLPLAVPVIRV
jgi:beta-glucosidase